MRAVIVVSYDYGGMEYSGNVFGFRSYLCHHRVGSNAVPTVDHDRELSSHHLVTIETNLQIHISWQNSSRPRDNLHIYKTSILLYQHYF